ncbi:MAG: hypothetical protein RLZ00_1261, partial [Pseudomonadota bacterium]
LAIFGHAKVAAVHGACGGAKARAAGVFKLLARLQEGLMPDDAEALDFFVRAVGIVHIPSAGDELCCHIPHIGDGDRVSKHVQTTVWVGLLRQVLRLNFNLKFVAWHGCDFG